MKDLSLHILDIVENSVKAGAKNIEITIAEETKKDLLTLEIIDDGKGMDEEFESKVTDPFVTTSKIRKIGLGLPLLKKSAEDANGELLIDSTEGIGTKIKATFQLCHIDRKPIGNITETLLTLVTGNPDIDFRYVHKKNGNKYIFDTKEIEKTLNGSKDGFLEKYMLIKKQLKEIK